MKAEQTLNIEIQNRKLLQKLRDIDENKDVRHFDDGTRKAFRTEERKYKQVNPIKHSAQHIYKPRPAENSPK